MQEPANCKISTAVGNRIRVRRCLLGISQEILGDAIGKSVQEVKAYEAGKAKVDGAELFLIACLFQTTVDYYFCDLFEELYVQSAHVFPSQSNTFN